MLSFVPSMVRCPFGKRGCPAPKGFVRRFPRMLYFWIALPPIADPMIRKYILCVGIMVLSLQARSQLVIARQGKVAFFSHTPVEHIKAENDRAMAIINLTTGEIAVSMLMKSFVFEKALMREHF